MHHDDMGLAVPVDPIHRAAVVSVGDSYGNTLADDQRTVQSRGETSRGTREGLFLRKVFPALALPALDAAFCGKLLGPCYSPARPKTFTLAGWRAVIMAVRRLAITESIAALAEWGDQLAAVDGPRKSDQDRLDGVLCAIIGLYWLTRARSESIMIGDRNLGYMIAPARNAVRARLEETAHLFGVPVDAHAPQ